MNRVKFKLEISPYWWLTRTTGDIGPMVHFAPDCDNEFDTAQWFVAQHTRIPLLLGKEL